jgi:hypothetical protein
MRSTNPVHRIEVKHSYFTDATDWQDIWDNCDWATFFESPEWFRIWINGQNAYYVTKVLRIDFADDVSCVVPLLFGKRMKGLIEQFEAGPAGTYGGPLSTSPLNWGHIHSIAEVLKSLGNFYLRLNPYVFKSTKIDKNRLNYDAIGVSYTSDATQTVNLSVTKDELEAQLRKKRIVQYATKLAEEGYSVRLISPSELKSFYAIYENAQARWEKVNIRHTIETFDQLISSNNCDFWGLYSDKNNLVGGGPVVTGNNIAVAWLPVMHSNVLSKRVYELFYYHVVGHYFENGYRWFDFNPSGGNDGVVKFKEKFQPQKYESPVISFKTGRTKLADAILAIKSGLLK